MQISVIIVALWTLISEGHNNETDCPLDKTPVINTLYKHLQHTLTYFYTFVPDQEVMSLRKTAGLSKTHQTERGLVG